MEELLDGLSEVTKDTASHVAVASAVAFSDENSIVHIVAYVGVTILAVAWLYHIHKLHKQHKTVKE